MATAAVVSRELRRVTRSVNRSTRRALTLSRRRIIINATRKMNADVGLKPAGVKKTIVKPTIESSGRRMRMRITFKKHAPNLARRQFRPRKTPTGLRVRLYGSSKIIPGGFLINNGRTAMKRVSRSRLPIRAITGPSSRRQFLNQFRQSHGELFKRQGSLVFRREFLRQMGL